MKRRTVTIEGYIMSDRSQKGSWWNAEEDSLYLLLNNSNKLDRDRMKYSLAHFISSKIDCDCKKRFIDTSNSEFQYERVLVCTADNIVIMYAIRSSKTTWEEIEEKYIKELSGKLQIKENILGNDEESIEVAELDLVIGGHDLGEELYDHIGEYLIMKISFDRKKL